MKLLLYFVEYVQWTLNTVVTGDSLSFIQKHVGKQLQTLQPPSSR